MSIRSTKLLVNVIQKRNLVPVVARKTSLPFTKYNIKFQNAFFHTSNSAGKQEAQKLSISSSELLQSARTEPKTSKMKDLTKKYGAAGVLVYLGVGCVDLGITLCAIQLVGLEKVKVLEEGVLDVVYNTGEKFGFKRKEKLNLEDAVVKPGENDTPSFASVFLLAYGIHKTLLLPVRLGITAAITPVIVRKLHQLGWTRYFPRLFGMSKS